MEKTMNNTTTIKNTIQTNSSTGNNTSRQSNTTGMSNSDNVTIMNNFREYMAKKYRPLKGWLVIWVSAFGVCLINGVKDYEGMGNHLYLPILAAILLFLAGSGYVSKYTKQGHLAELMISHAFDGKTYYGILAKKLIPLQAGSLLALALISLLQKTELTMAFLFGCMFLVLPQIPIAIKYIAYEKLVSQKNKALWTANIAFGKILESFFRIITLGTAFVEFTLFFLNTFGINPLMKGIDENTAVCFLFQNEFILVLCFILAVLISLFFSDIGVESPVLNWMNWIKFRKVAVISLLLIQLGCATYYCYSIQNSYVRLMEDSITMKNGDMVKTYGLDEIAFYRIFADNQALGMEVTFTDDTKQQLLWDSTEENNAWTEKFYSNYRYVAELTGRLKALGITGILADADVLDASVKTSASTIQSDYESIKANLR